MFLIQFFASNYLYLIVDAILLAGIAGFVVAYFCFFIPILIPYRPTIKLVSVVLLIAGSYYKGLLHTEEEWQQRIASVQAQLKIAEEKSKQETVRIETQVIERVKVVKEKVHENKKAIEKHKAVINAECKLPDVARMLYNRSVVHEIPGSPTSTNATGSGVKTSRSK